MCDHLYEIQVAFSLVSGQSAAAENEDNAMKGMSEGSVHWDPYDPKYFANPYPAFRRLREEAPLYYNEQYDFYAVSRFEDVARGLAACLTEAFN